MPYNRSEWKQAHTRKKGTEAEDLAVKYLKDKGYEVVKRNFHFGNFGEIDIICKDKEFLVFVEVRSKAKKDAIEPMETITFKKRKTLRKVAEGYLYVNKITEQPCRFDFIGVDFTRGEPQLQHIENAF